MNLFQKLQRHKNKGQISFLLVGLVCLWMVMFLCYFQLTYQKIELVKSSVEDEIVSAVLSGSVVDREIYSITGNIYVTDKQKSLKNFEEIFSYVENLSVLDSKGNAFNSKGEAVGLLTHPYFDFEDENKIKILEYTIYNVPLRANSEGDYIGEIYTFKNGSWSVVNTNCNYGKHIGETGETLYITTPLGEPVGKTAVYVELELPLKIGFFNIRNTVKKAQLVSIESLK